MKIKLDPGAYMPERAHADYQARNRVRVLTDAGLDIKSPKDCIIPAHDSATIYTGVHVIKLPPNTAGLLVSKSELNMRYNITSTGLIDEGYNGEIVVKLHNHGGLPYFVAKGDKITQLVVIPVLYEAVELVDDLQQDSERGDKGFGSTGR